MGMKTLTKLRQVQRRSSTLTPKQRKVYLLNMIKYMLALTDASEEDTLEGLLTSLHDLRSVLIFTG